MGTSALTRAAAASSIAIAAAAIAVPTAAAAEPSATPTPTKLSAASHSVVYDTADILWPSYSIHSKSSGCCASYFGLSVKNIQRALNARGARLAVDGRFGYGTRAAVIQWQKKRGLAVDGYVGPITWKSLGLRKVIIR